MHTISQKKQAKATLITFAGTFISRVLGVLRDTFLAYSLGPGADLFVAAFRIPNLFRRMVAEGTLGMEHTAQIASLFSTGQGAKTFEAMQLSLRLTQKTATCMALWMCALSLALGLCAFFVLGFLVPGFLADPHIMDKSVFYFRVCLAYLPFGAITAITAALLTAYGKFFVPAFSPAFLNIGIIFGGLVGIFLSMPQVSITQSFMDTILGLPIPPDRGTFFSLGVVLGGVLQCLWVVLFARTLFRAKGKHIYSYGAQEKHEQQGQLKKRKRFTGVFTLLGASSQQINMLAAIAAASYLSAGSITSLYFAERLMEMPVAFAGAAVATVSLPLLAGCTEHKGQNGFTYVLGRSCLLSLFLSLPAAAGLAAIAQPVVRFIFGYGFFGAEQQAITASALMVFCLALPAMCLCRLFSAAVTAEDTSSCGRGRLFLAFSSGASLILVICGCMIVSKTYGATGIAASVCAGTWLQTLLLFLWLVKKGCAPQVGAWGIARGFFYLAGAIILYCSVSALPFPMGGALALGGSLAAVCIGCLFIWFFFFALCKTDESLFFLSSCVKK